MRRSPIFLLKMCVLFLPSLIGCTKSDTRPEDRENQRQTAAPTKQTEVEPPAVIFDLRLAPDEAASGNLKLYDCTYERGGKTARFRLQLSYGALRGEMPIASALGKFIAVPGSDGSVLLKDLKQALEATRMPAAAVKRVSELPFDAVVLGENQSRNQDGSFSDRPSGDWIATKVFLPKGGDDGEMFLNINPVLGKGEFSIKDSDYGDYLLAELARVL